MNHPVYKLIHNHTSTQDYLQYVNGAKRKWLIGYDSYSLREKQEGSKLLSVDGWFIGETKQNIHEYRKVPDLTRTRSWQIWNVFWLYDWCMQVIILCRFISCPFYTVAWFSHYYLIHGYNKTIYYSHCKKKKKYCNWPIKYPTKGFNCQMILLKALEQLLNWTCEILCFEVKNELWTFILYVLNAVGRWLLGAVVYFTWRCWCQSSVIISNYRKGNKANAQIRYDGAL